MHMKKSEEKILERFEKASQKNKKTIEKAEKKNKALMNRKSKKNANKLKPIFAVLTSLATIILISVTLLFSNSGKSEFHPEGEIARSMTYERVQPGDEKKDIDTEFVQFDAFFLRDLDGDGTADGIRGTCKNIGEEDILYMQLNVLTNGHLENGVITINSDNFFLETAIPKDNEVSENTIGSNIKEIKLNNINSGTQKLLTGTVRSGNYSYQSGKTLALGNDVSNYSKVNSVTLKGVHVADDQQHTRTEINKTVEFKVDWHGYVKASLININQEKDIQTSINEQKGELNLSFTIQAQETREELILKRAVAEGTIPKLNGVDPLRVESLDKSVELNYNSNDRTFTAQRKSTLDEQNQKLTSTISRANSFQINITYPLSAFVNLGTEYIKLEIPVTTYYEGYNNSNAEFRNPEKSNILNGVLKITYRKRQEATYATTFDVTVGKYTYQPTRRYIVSKEKPLKIYNQISSEEKNDNYIVEWYCSLSQDQQGNEVVMRETGGNLTRDESGNIIGGSTPKVADEFIKNGSASSESMEEITSNVGIYLSYPGSMVDDQGEIKVYDDETDELLVTFNKSNWNKCGSNNPYMYERPVKHIRVEITKTKVEPYSSLSVYNIKQLNDEVITTKYGKEDFENLKYIKSTLNAYIGGRFSRLVTNRANYEEPYSIATINLSKSTISTQETEKNMKITINAQADPNINQVKWTNGAFVLKMPRDIIDIKLNDVTASEANNRVKVTSYEQFKENGINYIKINTKNDKETTFTLSVYADITADPRITTRTEAIELYYYNENAVQYLEKGEDELDVNDNLNKKELVGKKSVNITLASPDSLLTSQTATNYDNKNSIAVAPQIALVAKQSTADITISLTNNYSSTISEVKILGRVPFRGNKYTINGSSLGSEFDVQMASAINLPQSLSQIAKVYYSTNGEATKDVKDPNNQWKTFQELNGNLSEVKSYLIDLGNYALQREKQENISYKIKIPANLNYNQVSYSHHAVYFSLDTQEGKYRTQTEPNKIGFMIAKQYDLELIKYQKGIDFVVPEATYLIMEKGQEDKKEGKTKVTGEDGKLILKGLYVDRTYTIKEIKTPTDYELNEEEVQFKMTEKNGTLEIDETETNRKTAKEINVIKPDGSEVDVVSSGYKVQVKVEDEVKSSLKIIKIEKKETGEQTKLNGVRFKLTGKNFENGRVSTTNTEGILNLNGLSIGADYLLEEVKADGYYLLEPIRFKILNNEGVYSVKFLEEGGQELNVTPSVVENVTTAVNENIPEISLTLKNEKIPTYDLEIKKVEKGGEQKPLEGAKFRLFKGTQKIDDYITNGEGTITIKNLYQYNQLKELDQTYTLKEILAPEGYSAVKDITFQVRKNEEGLLVMDVKEGTIKSSNAEGNKMTITIEDSPSFKLIKMDGEELEKGNEVFLPNTKFAIYNVDDGTEQLALDSRYNILGKKEIINGKEYYVLETNENGEIEANLREGLYKAVEIEANNEKYDITNNVYYFGIGTSRQAPESYAVEDVTLIGESGDDRINAVAKTSDGGFVVGGVFKSSSIQVGGQTLNSEGNSTGLIIKYKIDESNEGEYKIEWLTTLGAPVYSIAETIDGGIVAGGYFQDNSVKIGDNTFTLKGKSDGYIIKYKKISNSENYEAEWSTKIGGLYYDYIYSVSATSDGGFVAGGNFRGTTMSVGSYTLDGKGNNNDTGLIIKYTPVATDEKYNVDWASSLGTTNNSYIQSVEATPEGDILVGGYYTGNLELGNGYTFNNDNTTTQNGMIIKYTAVAGPEKYNVDWATTISGNQHNYIQSITQTADKGILVGGYFQSTSLTIGSYNLVNPGSNYSGMVIKYIPVEGSEKYKADWATVVGGTGIDNVYAVSESEDGKILVGGKTYSTDIDLGNYKFKNTSYLTSFTDGIVVSYAPVEGNEKYKVEWATLVGGDKNEVVEGILQTKDGKIIMGGYSSSEIVKIGGETFKSTDNYNGMIIKCEKKELANPVTINAVSIGESSNEQINSITQTSDGGHIAVGHFSSTKIKAGNYTLENNSTSTSYIDGMIIKYDMNGQIEWATSVGGNYSDYIYSVIETKDGGILVGGYFNSRSIALEGYTLTNNSSSYDGMIIKYSADGKVEWATSLGGSSSDYIYSVAETTNGDLVAGGYFNSSSIELGEYKLEKSDSTSYPDGMIIKYTPIDSDEKYKINWTTSVGGSNEDIITSLSQTSDGGILVGGTFKGSNIQIGEYELTNKGSVVYTDGMIIKYDMNGQIEWATSVGGNYEDAITSLKETSDGGILVGGSFKGNSIQIGEYEFKGSTSYSSGMIIKYNANKEVEWATAVGGDKSDKITSVAETADGGIVAGGNFESSSIQLGDYILEPKGSTDAMVVKYKKGNGKYTLEWAKAIGGTTNDEISSVVQLKDGTILAGGHYKSGKIETDGKQLTNQGNYDAMMLKIANMAGIPEVTELKVKNYRKEFKITTEVKQIGEEKGGKISGEDKKPYEIVKYGENSTNQILMEPNSGYEIISVTVNGEEWPFEADKATGNYEMQKFTNVTKDMHVVVTYSKKTNKLVIKKVDNKTQSPIAGVKFRLDEIDGANSGILIETNSKGEAITQVQYGMYSITELNTPEGYIPLEETIKIDFEESNKSVIASEGSSQQVARYDSSTGMYIIENKKKAKVIVHHYAQNEFNEDRSPKKVAEDEFIEGKIDEEYITKPRMDLEKYEPVQDQLVEHATGKFTEADIEVIYYYEIKKIPLTVHHYIDGTENPVPLVGYEENEQNVAQDEHDLGLEGQGYVTKALTEQPEADERQLLNPKYKLTTMPQNATGKYDYAEINITYYYGVKSSAGVLVKHIDKNTRSEIAPSETLPAEGEGQGQYGDQYTTQASTKIPQNYKLAVRPQNWQGTMKEELTEVIYEYDLKEPEVIGQTVTKEATPEITSKGEPVEYTINYTATVSEYMGQVQITIVDQLPCGIEKNESDLQGGEYDEEAHTITWKDLQDVDTYTNGEVPEGQAEGKKQLTVSFSKTISVVFKDLDVNLEKIQNKVNGKLKFLSTEKESDEIEYTAETLPNFKTKLKVIKSWDDQEDRATKRPTQIKIIVKNKQLGDQTVAEMTLTKEQHKKIDDESTWEYTFTELPKYNADGTLAEYTVEEREVEDDDLKFYKKAEIVESETIEQATDLESNGEEIKTFTITNTFEVPNETTSVRAIKVWDHTNNVYERPSKVKLQLMKKDAEGNKTKVTVHGVDVEGEVSQANKVTGTEDNENKETWRYVFTGLPKYDDLGNKIEYCVDEVEEGLSYYRKTIDDETNTITNTYIGPIITSNKTVSTENNTGYVVEGETITYKIEITNSGEVAKEVKVQDKAPNGTSFVQKSIKINNNANYNNIDYSEKTETELEQGIGVQVEGNQTVTLSFDVTVNDLGPETYSQAIKNTATVDEVETKEVEVQVEKAKMKYGKTGEIERGEISNSLEEGAIGGTQVTQGDIIKYQITLTNDGTAPKTILVTDAIPEGTSFVAGSLKIGGRTTYKQESLENKDANYLLTGIEIEVPAGNSIIVEYKVTVDDFDNDAKIENEAVIKDPKEPENEEKQERTNTVTHTYVEPDITSKKEVTIKNEQLGYVLEGQEVTYMITVENSGSLEKEVTIQDSIPEGLTFKEGSIRINEQENFKVDGIEKDLTQLGKVNLEEGIKVIVPGKKVLDAEEQTKVENGKLVLTFKVTVDDLNKGEVAEKVYEKAIKNIAIVDGKNAESKEVEVKKTDLNITKESSPENGSTVQKDETITYIIHVTNTKGTMPARVIVKDSIPDGTTFVPESIQVDNSNSYNLDGEDIQLAEKGEADLNKGIEIEVPAQGEKVLSFKVTVNDLDNDAKITNRANLIDITEKKDEEEPDDPEYPDMPKKESNEVVHNYGEGIISQSKKAQTQYGKDYVVKGEEITYTITVENAGSVEKEVTIRDNLPEEVDFVNGTIQINKLSEYEVNGENKTLSELTQKELEEGIKVKVPAKHKKLDGEEANIEGTEEVKGKIELSFRVKVKKGVEGKTIIENQATVDENPTGTTQNTVKAPKISTEKVAIVKEGRNFVVQGDIIKYVITVKNEGDLGENVLIKDSISEGTSFVDGSIRVNEETSNEVNGKEVDVSSKTQQDLEEGIVVYVEPKTDEVLPAVTTLSFEVMVKDEVQEEEITGDIKNKAITKEIEDKENPQDPEVQENPETPTDEVKTPIVTFEKKAKINRIASVERGQDEDGGLDAEGKQKLGKNEVTAEDEITYTIKVTNTGTITAENIEVKDTVPEGTRLKEANEASQVQGEKEITWIIPSLNTEESKELTFTVIVNYAQEDQKIKNVAYIEEKGSNEVETEYKKPEIILTTEVEKTAVETITSTETPIYYTINYTARIENFVGKAVITIVDTLPYKIDVSKSQIPDEGVYDPEKKTITWTETVNEIDTYKNIETKEISRTKSMSLTYIYEDVENLKGKIVNTVTATTDLKQPDIPEDKTVKTDEQTDTHEIEAQIPAKVIVHHYFYDEENDVATQIKVAEDKEQTGKIGESYTTSKSEEVPQNYTCKDETPDKHEGNMTKTPIEVIYYYTLNDETIENEMTKTAKASKTVERQEQKEADLEPKVVNVEVLTDEDGEVTYNIKYKINIRDYIGKAKITIVDKLPSAIDKDASQLQEGKYNSADNTITWEETIENINTYKDGLLTPEHPEDGVVTEGRFEKTIEKQIKVVYDNQNPVGNLVNTATGSITTYYPDILEPIKPELEKETKKQEDTSTVEQEYKVDKVVEKRWDDNDNSKEHRPNSVNVQLTANGQTTWNDKTLESVVLSDSNNWTHTFTNLPKYDERGALINYSVQESESNPGELEYYVQPPQITITENKDVTDSGSEVNDQETSEQEVEKQESDETNPGADKQGPEEIEPGADKQELDEKETPNQIGKIIVTNEYRLNNVRIDSDINKTGTEEITNENRIVTYKIKYHAVINDYIGEATLTITDTLPYEIDKDKSNIAGGEYDEDLKTITWKQELGHINTVENGAKVVDVEKEITVEYKDLDVKKEKITNNVKGKIEFTENETKNEVETSYDTNVNITGKLVVKYVDKDTGEEIVQTIEPGQPGNEDGTEPIEKKYSYEKDLKVGSDYQTEKEEIPGYNWVGVEGNAEGKIVEGATEVTYYYERKNSGGVTAKYVDEDGNEITDPQIIEGKVGDSYKTKDKQDELENYELVETTGDAPEGRLEEGSKEVVYHYRKLTAKVIVRYLEKETNKVLEQEKVIEGKVGDLYETARKVIEGYRKAGNEPENSSGKMERNNENNTIYVTYYYEKIPSGKITVKYLDKETGEEITRTIKPGEPGNEEGKEDLKTTYVEELQGYVGERYETKEKEIPYYKYLEELAPTNKEGLYKEDNDTVIYYYQKLNFNFSVEKRITEASIDGKQAKVDDEGKIIKLEVVAKKVTTSKVEVKYEVVVTNTGEIEGTANIKETLPAGFKTSNSNPSYWEKQTDGTLTTEVKLNPGQSENLEVVAIWKNGNNNFGTMRNQVQITDTTNPANYLDSSKDDNESQADVVMSIKTGAEQKVLGVALGTIATAGLLILLYQYQKYQKERNREIRHVVLDGKNVVIRKKKQK